MTEEQRIEADKGPTPGGSIQKSTGEAAGFKAKNIQRFFIAGFFNSLLRAG